MKSLLCAVSALFAWSALPLHAAPGVIKVEAEEVQPQPNPQADAATTTPASPSASAPDFVLHAKLVEISTLDKEVPMPKNPAEIANLRGADLTSAPDLKVHFGALSKISFSRDFALPNGENYPIGVALRLRPVSKEPGVSYTLDYDVTEFTGYDVQKTTRASKFTTTHTLGLQGAALFGKELVFELASRTNQFQGGTYRHKTFVIISFSKE